MKKICIIILLFIWQPMLMADDIIPVSGKVMEINSFEPVPFHPVEIFADSGLFLGVLYTDEFGNFHDTIKSTGIQFEFIYLSTYDCLLEPHIMQFPLPAPSGIFAEFYICVDSIPVDCYASFVPLVNNTDPLTYSFINTSIGMFDMILWDFGDGNTSNDYYPEHTFPENGEYLVCLTIYSSDSIFPCFDSYCEFLIIGDTLSCRADFEVSPDSLNNIPNQFVFFDMSSGDIDSWFWDFGDGNTSMEQHPTHVYETEGTYEVCLTVSNFSNPSFCFDSFCQTIETPDYVFFGGQLFAGEYPINNPSSTGDTGVAYLYRKVSETIVAVDTQYFFNPYGLYAFNYLLEGEYLVKAGLTPGSSRYDQFFPVYQPDKLLWQQSEFLSLTDTSYDINLHMIPLPFMATGPGKISGTVVILNDKHHVNQSSSANIDVMLLGSDHQPLRKTLTDYSGYFEFTDLPFNTYYVTADLTGWDAHIQTTELNEGYVSALGMIIGLSESGTLDVEEQLAKESYKILLFPNPVKEKLNIELDVDRQQTIFLTISDLTGRIIRNEQKAVATGKQLIGIDVGHLPPGVYLLSIRNPGDALMGVKKFIK